MVHFNFSFGALRHRKIKRNYAREVARGKARAMESLRNTIGHYSDLIVEVTAKYDAMRVTIESGNTPHPSLSQLFHDIARNGALISDKLLSIVEGPLKDMVPEAEAKSHQLIRFHDYSKKALALTFALDMNSMPLTVARKTSPANSRGKNAEISYISHVLCAHVCELEALVNRVLRSDATVKRHDLKLARLLPLKMLYVMSQRIEELTPTLTEEELSAVRGYELHIEHNVKVLTNLGDMSDEERLAKEWSFVELTFLGLNGDIWWDVPLPI